ncbi:MAG: cytochrome c [Rhodopseudomonas sp.]|nr:cytochrome c [Rhodopseudomonas sp.]
MKKLKNHATSAISLASLIVVGLAAFVYSGVYNIGADDHHSSVVFATIQTLRDRSIAIRSSELQVPSLKDDNLVLKGAGQYAAMCVQCHLSPEKENSELRVGMYPQPPNLSKVRVNPKAAFWVIKHGIKMSAMPAWGGSHDDPTIWSMVAFLRKLPDMTAADYKEIVAKAPPDEDMDSEAGHGHSHHD